VLRRLADSSPTPSPVPFPSGISYSLIHRLNLFSTLHKRVSLTPVTKFATGKKTILSPELRPSVQPNPTSQNFVLFIPLVKRMRFVLLPKCMTQRDYDSLNELNFHLAHSLFPRRMLKERGF